MKPFARINLSFAALRRGILVSSLALAVVTFFGGCDRWQRSVEARNFGLPPKVEGSAARSV